MVRAENGIVLRRVNEHKIYKAAKAGGLKEYLRSKISRYCSAYTTIVDIDIVLSSQARCFSIIPCSTRR